MSERLKENPANTFLGKKHTAETRKKMSEKAKVTAREHRNGWKAGNNRMPNKYELFAEQFLIANGVTFKKEYVLPHSKLGNPKGELLST